MQLTVILFSIFQVAPNRNNINKHCATQIDRLQKTIMAFILRTTTQHEVYIHSNSPCFRFPCIFALRPVPVGGWFVLIQVWVLYICLMFSIMTRWVQRFLVITESTWLPSMVTKHLNIHSVTAWRGQCTWQKFYTFFCYLTANGDLDLSQEISFGPRTKDARFFAIIF